MSQTDTQKNWNNFFDNKKPRKNYGKIFMPIIIIIITVILGKYYINNVQGTTNSDTSISSNSLSEVIRSSTSLSNHDSEIIQRTKTFCVEFNTYKDSLNLSQPNQINIDDIQNYITKANELITYLENNNGLIIQDWIDKTIINTQNVVIFCNSLIDYRQKEFSVDNYNNIINLYNYYANGSNDNNNLLESIFNENGIENFRDEDGALNYTYEIYY